MIEIENGMNIINDDNRGEIECDDDDRRKRASYLINQQLYSNNADNKKLPTNK